MSGVDVLKSHLPDDGQDVRLGRFSILVHSGRSTRELLAVDPGFEEAFECNLSALVGQAIVDLAEGLLDPVTAFFLGFTVFGKPPPGKADLSTPEAVLAKVQTAFVVSSPSSHVHASFL